MKIFNMISKPVSIDKDLTLDSNGVSWTQALH